MLKKDLDVFTYLQHFSFEKSFLKISTPIDAIVTSSVIA